MLTIKEAIATINTEIHVSDLPKYLCYETTYNSYMKVVNQITDWVNDSNNSDHKIKILLAGRLNRCANYSNVLASYQIDSDSIDLYNVAAILLIRRIGVLTHINFEEFYNDYCKM